jgi:hypothetical protein
MNVIRQRGNGNTQGYRKLKNIQNRWKFFSRSDPNICTEDDTQFEDIRVSDSCCYLIMEETVTILRGKKAIRAGEKSYY